MGDALDIYQGDIMFPPLDAPHIRAINPGDIGKSFLRNAPFVPASTDYRPECGDYMYLA